MTIFVIDRCHNMTIKQRSPIWHVTVIQNLHHLDLRVLAVLVEVATQKATTTLQNKPVHNVIHLLKLAVAPGTMPVEAE